MRAIVSSFFILSQTEARDCLQWRDGDDFFELYLRLSRESSKIKDQRLPFRSSSSSRSPRSPRFSPIILATCRWQRTSRRRECAIASRCALSPFFCLLKFSQATWATESTKGKQPEEKKNTHLLKLPANAVPITIFIAKYNFIGLIDEQDEKKYFYASDPALSLRVDREACVHRNIFCYTFRDQWIRRRFVRTFFLLFHFKFSLVFDRWSIFKNNRSATPETRSFIWSTGTGTIKRRG